MQNSEITITKKEVVSTSDTSIRAQFAAKYVVKEWNKDENKHYFEVVNPFDKSKTYTISVSTSKRSTLACSKLEKDKVYLLDTNILTNKYRANVRKIFLNDVRDFDKEDWSSEFTHYVDESPIHIFTRIEGNYVFEIPVTSTQGFKRSMYARGNDYDEQGMWSKLVEGTGDVQFFLKSVPNHYEFNTSEGNYLVFEKTWSKGDITGKVFDLVLAVYYKNDSSN